MTGSSSPSNECPEFKTSFNLRHDTVQPGQNVLHMMARTVKGASQTVHPGEHKPNRDRRYQVH